VRLDRDAGKFGAIITTNNHVTITSAIETVAMPINKPPILFFRADGSRFLMRVLRIRSQRGSFPFRLKKSAGGLLIDHYRTGTLALQVRNIITEWGTGGYRYHSRLARTARHLHAGAVFDSLLTTANMSPRSAPMLCDGLNSGKSLKRFQRILLSRNSNDARTRLHLGHGITPRRGRVKLTKYTIAVKTPRLCQAREFIKRACPA